MTPEQVFAALQSAMPALRWRIRDREFRSCEFHGQLDQNAPLNRRESRVVLEVVNAAFESEPRLFFEMPNSSLERLPPVPPDVLANTIKDRLTAFAKDRIRQGQVYLASITNPSPPQEKTDD